MKLFSTPSFVRIPLMALAAVTALTFAAPAQARDRHDHGRDRKHDHSRHDKGRGHRDHNLGGDRDGHRHGGHNHIETRSCSSHHHHHSHIWHSRDHRDFRCPGHE